ncbi:bifunctional adenosylcobinamide kinase/adenosylcobinamide-phosphate guanylyltransferase [Mesobacillus zeae]|uniref:Adenosylcobinamide kinase n=1 Tax=Mesobacillus zeae TaxID=1917180 RepID=A0A398B7G0_9BACI|nr:bifunctional adenosylcobinamide kinase/adenosylcobinamide-phosphate guanylyltransferase [Mesobacillus zeae]RID85737.1 bifunctional adenosylcobinamide kinase/adenosylcobinamide-phosphate guanylyltransferase [Mesobacillus zeae]
MEKKQSLIFITGGVRSGKSSFAEKLAAEMAGQISGNLHYIAAGKRSDHEMDQRIKRHQEDRKKSGLNWKTWEEHNLASLSGAFSKSDIVLLDCLTTLLNQEFFQNGEEWRDPVFQVRTMDRIVSGVEEIARSAYSLIAVSNEIFHEPAGSTSMVLAYTRMLGKIHQRVAEKADTFYLVEAGIPLLLKGDEAP